MQVTPIAPEKQNSCCGSTYAAKVLGLSVGTVQKLVDANALHSWRTDGGHRRISMKSLEKYRKENYKEMHAVRINYRHKQVIIVEDDFNTKKMYESFFEALDLDFEVLIYSSAVNALLDLHTLSPVLLVTDLRMPHMNGFQFIKTVRKKQSFASIPIVAVTGLSDEEIKENGGLDQDILIITKPIDMSWFKGFIQAIVSVAY
jgi:excisionase family DNA binding protein